MGRKFLGVILSVLLPVVSLAYSEAQQNHIENLNGDTQLVQALHQRRNVNFVEAADLVVTKILPDDTKGLPHQRWVARVSDGTTVMMIYNSDMGVRIPVKVGDHFSAGGQFIWTPEGGLLHWLHEDPRNKRPDGFIYMNGTIYGDGGNDQRQ